jgi:hypothetical protein
VNKADADSPNLDDLAGQLAQLAPAAGGNDVPADQSAPIIVKNEISIGGLNFDGGFAPTGVDQFRDDGSSGRGGTFFVESDPVASVAGPAAPGNTFDFRGSTSPVTFSGSGGADIIFGGSAGDELNGGDGDDFIDGGAGNDRLTGGPGNDTVFGGDGDDILIGGTGEGDDSYDGGDGQDTLIFSSAVSGIIVDLSAGTSQGPDIDFDHFVAVETFVGGSGDDLFIGGPGDHHLDGGPGNDTIDYGGALGNVSVDLSSGTAASADFGNDTLVSFESVVTGIGNDTLSGSAGNETLDGGGGDDLLIGGGGSDVYRVALGGGNDVIREADGGRDRLVITGLSPDLHEFGGPARDGDDLLLALGSDTVRVEDYFSAGNIARIAFETEAGFAQTLNATQLAPILVAHNLATEIPFEEAIEGTGTGIVSSDLTLANDNPVTVTFINEIAGFRNSLGYYVIGTDGTIGEVGIVWENASAVGDGGDLVPGISSVTLDLAAGERFSFFMIQSGFDQNDFSSFGSGQFAFIDHDLPATTSSVAPSLVFIDSAGVMHTVAGNIFHATDSAETALSSDGQIHVKSGIDSGTGGLVIGFEDAFNLGDSDFNDLTIRVDFANAAGNEFDPLTIASGIEIPGDGDTLLTGAEISIAVGFVTGDAIVVPSLEETGITILQNGFDAELGTYRLLLTGAATADVYSSVLSGLQLQSTADSTAAGTRTVSFNVTGSDSQVTHVADASVTLLPAAVQTGTAADDTLTGTTGNDVLSGSGGDDLIAGGGGKDILHGDGGDDTLAVGDASFVLAAGDSGMDTLVVGFDLDLTSLSNDRILGIELFDLRGGGDSTLTLTLQDVISATYGVNALTGAENSLVVRRDGGDVVLVNGNGLTSSQATLDADNDGIQESYTVFRDTPTGAEVYVENLT